MGCDWGMSVHMGWRSNWIRGRFRGRIKVKDCGTWLEGVRGVMGGELRYLARVV